MPDTLKIKKISDIGTTPFRVIEVEEKILQGYDAAIKKSLYLFKSDLGNWAYYDPNSKMTIEVAQWRDKDKAAMVNGRWVKMSIYYRTHIAFETPVLLNKYQSGHVEQVSAWDVVINIPKKVYEQLEQQMVGRDPNSYYQFSYKTLAKGPAVESVTFVK